jgi:hypothetical protein
MDNLKDQYFSLCRAEDSKSTLELRSNERSTNGRPLLRVRRTGSCVAAHHLQQAQEHGLRLLPGPWKLPVIGTLHHLVGQLPYQAMRDLARRHGPVMLLRNGEVPTLVVLSREAAREEVKTHDTAFASRPLSSTIRVLICGGRTSSSRRTETTGASAGSSPSAPSASRTLTHAARVRRGGIALHRDVRAT